MRPMYETPSDIINELSVIESLSDLWGVTFHKLPIQYHLDFSISKIDGRIIGFIEVKTRTIAKSKFPTYIISMSKIQMAKSMFDTSKQPTFLVVQWTDAIGWCRIDSFEEIPPFKIGGRTDRGDEQDIEPVLHIPIHLFRDIKDPPESIVPRRKRRKMSA